MEEFKLRVIYIPANPPSPVPEESEEGSPPREDENEQAALAAAVSVFKRRFCKLLSAYFQVG